MNILIYTHGFAPTIGGAETYVMHLAEGLAKTPAANRTGGLRIQVATPTPAGAFDDSKLAFQLVRRPGLLRLARLVREADIVHLSGPCLLPLLLAWVFRKRAVVEHHGYTASCPNGLLFFEPAQSVCPGHFMCRRYRECIRCNLQKEGWIGSSWMLLSTFPRRWLCRRVAANIPITNHVRKRVDLPRSVVIYYGIPDSTSHYAPDESLDTACFGYVGRLVPLKGLQVLVQAARILKEQGYLFRVKLIGDGPERVSLESLVRDLNLEEKFEFAGPETGPGLRSATESVSTVIMPSIWEETAGLSAIEQMMRGRLVIASDIGGLAEIIGEAGLKCPAKDAASLAEKMKIVLQHPEIARQFGSAARARALSLFRREEMIDKHLQLYGSLVRCGAPGGKLSAV
jgi:glycosyltransferase involved in cell wall biosynthesis